MTILFPCETQTWFTNDQKQIQDFRFHKDPFNFGIDVANGFSLEDNLFRSRSKLMGSRGGREVLFSRFLFLWSHPNFPAFSIYVDQALMDVDSMS